MKNENNFDLLRLVFAVIVFLVHAQILSQNTDLAPLAGWLSSEMAIQGFFVISGYLVYMSYQNSRSLLHYLQKRTRRIYPAYLAVILLCVVLGAAFTSRSLGDYLSMDLAKYVAANLLFLNFLAPDLPGVFEGNSLQAVNGALWTLKIEIMFYLVVPLITWVAKRHGHTLTLSLLYVTSISYAMEMQHLYAATGQELYRSLSHQLPGQLAYFVTGIALYHWRVVLPKLRVWLLPALLVLCFVSAPVLSAVLRPAALGLVVILVALTCPPLGRFGRHGDLSYGTYILHFPILQALIELDLFRPTGWLGLAIAIALVIPAAFLSWHLIEKRWLPKTSHYMVAAQGS